MMSDSLLTVLFFALFLLLLFGGMSIAAGMALATLLVLYLIQGPIGLSAAGPLVFDQLNNWVFLSVPLFIFMSELVFHFEIGKDLFDMARKWFGQLPGGLGIATILACAVFGAMCGTSSAAVAAVGANALPELQSGGYNKRLSLGVVAAPGALAILIPPSLDMVLFGSVTDVSIGKLFIAGILPGIMLALLMCGYILLRVLKNPALAPLLKGISWKERFASLKYLWMAAVLILAVTGTIYAGIVTPTEAAAFGAMGVIIVGAIMRRFTFRRLWTAASATARITGMLAFLFASVALFDRALALLGVTQGLANFVAALTVPPWAIIILMNLLLMFLGCIMASSAIVLMVSPILLPIAVAAGFNPIWFGIIMVINMEMAVITPPVAVNLWIVKGIAKETSMTDITMGTLPYIGIEVLAIVILYFFPQIALWLPSRLT